ncbi:MAG: hypothetical protein ACOX5R_08480 [bacterium]|jgi:hypothetical protein
MKFIRSTIPLALLVSVMTSLTWGAVVHTYEHGNREGRVIVREFESPVITVLTEDNRIFQFPVDMVERISASDNVLIGKNIILRASPASDAQPVLEIPLNRGLEVLVLDSTQPDWIKIRGWGANEGWIPRDILTNEVNFEEQPQEPEPIETAPAMIPSATPGAATSGINIATPASPIQPSATGTEILSPEPVIPSATPEEQAAAPELPAVTPDVQSIAPELKPTTPTVSDTTESADVPESATP